MNRGPTNTPWFHAAFETPYLTLYRHRTDEAAESEVAWAATQLPTGALLDLACGNGRHARALGRRGFDVTGLDYSADLLASAARGPGRFVRGDMRRLPLASAHFDAVTCFFTSFGYFADERDDRCVLQEVARVLKVGGTFLLDFLHEARVRKTLVPETDDTVDGIRLRQRRWITDDGRRVEKEVQITGNDRPTQRYVESVRLYTPDELETLLTDAGLTPTGRYGTLAGDTFQPDSPRVVCLARRTVRDPA